MRLLLLPLQRGEGGNPHYPVMRTKLATAVAPQGAGPSRIGSRPVRLRTFSGMLMAAVAEIIGERRGRGGDC